MARITPDRRRTRLSVLAEVTEGEPGQGEPGQGEPGPVDPAADGRPEMVIEASNGAVVKIRFDLPPRP